MIAFLKFQASKCDYAVIECGIGARLDSTNIVNPEISCITSVGLDHCEALGETIEKIAYEKSFCIKPGKPFVAGINTPVEMLQKIAEEKKSQFVPVVPPEEVKNAERGLTFYEENNLTAKTILTTLN